MHELNISDLEVSYSGTPVVEGVSFDVTEGEIVCIVGESGSGKTTVIRAILGLLPVNGIITGGNIAFDGKSLLTYSRAQWLGLRRRQISMVFQDTGAMLNPIRRVGEQYVEYIRSAQPTMSASKALELAVTMLDRMLLPDPQRVLESYIFELSGGMRQRVGIAMAMTFNPSFILADEPTSALDVTVQSEIARQILHVRDEYGTGFVIVTHNIGLAAFLADQVLVMRSGRVVESGSTSTVISTPQDVYTKSLLASVPRL